ncbi:MAG: hypothetical protein AAF570_16830, partial [Bacteroidota bacterium]
MDTKAQQALRKQLELIEAERQAERAQYRERVLNMPLAERKAQGFTWYPVQVDEVEIGFGDRLVLKIPQPEGEGGRGLFQTGSIAALWSNAEANRKQKPFVTG